MADHAALTPSFRDFSYLRPETLGPQLPELRRPTVLEVERILRDSPAGKLNRAISTEGWPWIDRMAFLDSAIPGIKVHSLGGLVPFQADGIWGAFEWYYRERGGGSSLRLSPIGSFPGVSESLYGASGDADEFAGSSGWLNRFLALWERLSVDTFLYEFDAREVSIVRSESDERIIEFVPTGESMVQYGRGHSAEEAWESAGSYSAYLDEKLGMDRSAQAHYRELMEISRTPLNSDERVFPLEAPDFRVNWDGLEVPDELGRFLESSEEL